MNALESPTLKVICSTHGGSEMWIDVNLRSKLSAYAKKKAGI